MKHQVQFLIEVLKAVVFGSTSRSPLFHLSCTPEGAYSYALKAQRSRMEPAEKQMFTNIDLMEMFKDGVIDEYNLIDISTEAAFNSFFSPLLDGSNKIDEKTKKWIWQTRKHSSKCQELMFCWRGK